MTMFELNFYILDRNNEPVRCYDFIEWALWLGQNNRIKKTSIGRIKISTVFLGIDHNPFSNGDIKKGLWFETMVLDGPMNLYKERYTTIEEALTEHDRLVQDTISRQ